ncbi:MAG TPA: MlaD family protein [Polyangiaceae bacterium]|nr:MlaD family protein [Polyangiaceae bacterium]
MTSRDVKVGAFVLASLVLIGALIFLIGNEAQMFARHVKLQASFTDVQGLTRGSPVRMGGVDIGSVSDLGYGSAAKDEKIYVTLSVVTSEARRIRKDSIASVEGKGLLGDKMVVITVGSPDSPELQPGEMLKSNESKDITEILTEVKNVAAGANRIVVNLEKTTEALADQSLHQNVKGSVEHLNGVLAALDEGDGYLGRLLHDKAEADRLSATIDSLHRAGDQLERLLANTNQVMERVRTGPGLVHRVIYAEDGERTLEQFGGAADELRQTLRGIRENPSLVHGLLYEKESGEMLDNLNRATADLEEILRGIKEGKGTVGALLTDPSVYEDVKVLLGNVGRNRSLRALVRYSISRDESTGRVQDESSSSSAPVSSEAGTDASQSVSPAP